ncbi:MAG: LEA14-like dessication related protein [Cocleimonas sp.]|jgi:LEA14-like dessication related protein
MLKQTIFKNVVLVILICFSNNVYAGSDSTKIGISVQIKSKQACDFSYALDGSSNMQYSRQTHFSNCDESTLKLQQQANQIVKSEFSVTESMADEKRLRVFMVVQ